MTITPYGIGAQTAQRSTELFGSIKGTLGTLQTQLSTGEVAPTYGGYRQGAASALYLNQRLSMLGSYSDAIGAAQTRVKLAGAGLQQLSKLAATLGTTLTATPSTLATQQASMLTARGNLAEAIDGLNTDVNGAYLFSGRAADTKPVEPLGLILDGDATHAGLKQLVAERKAADLGSAGQGRLTIASSGTTTTLSEEAAGLPFGFKIAGATATGTGLTAATAAGPPKSAAVTVASQPGAGDSVSFALTLPDGTSTTLTLTARASSTPATSGSFAIGATAADTAANLQAALTGAVQTSATTALASASTFRTSTDFFASSVSSPPARVDGPPFDTATALTAGTAADTVIWYQGDDAAGSARETAPVRVGDSQVVAIGLRANEPALQAVLASYGAIAADSFAQADPTANARFDALATKLSAVLQAPSGVPAVNTVATDLSNALVALNNASDRIKATTNQVYAALDPIENVSTLDVTQSLVETQTRLQASYQVTSAIAKLSLNDYLT